VADKMGLSKVKLFPAAAMGKIANLHVPVLKRRVQGGLDGYGKRFKIYTRQYMEAKSDGFKSKRTGKRISSMKQRSLNTQVFPPNLTLTGLMLSNLKRRFYNKREYKIGWDGEAAEKVQGNADNGRNIIDEIPDKEKTFLVKLLEKEVGKQFKKLKNVTITVGK
jgi:hypothetical protein